MTPLGCYCCICKSHMNWNERCGRDGTCCSKGCYEEFDWRRTLSILGKPYEPDPRRLRAARQQLEQPPNHPKE